MKTEHEDRTTKVEVVRSARRTKTVQARLVGGVLRVSIPAHFSVADEAHWVAEMRRRIARKRRSDTVDLVARAGTLARRHGLPCPDEILWSDRQNTRWGSCTPSTGRVRIARQLADYPRWVLDYVIVHELAHLAEPSHSPTFWALAARYPLSERARGYLIAKGHEPLDSPAPAPLADFPG